MAKLLWETFFSINRIRPLTITYEEFAPNYDATLYPRLLAKRGVQLGGQFRYLTRYTAESNAWAEFQRHRGLFGLLALTDTEEAVAGKLYEALRVRIEGYTCLVSSPDPS